jgi:hypothetical protein
MSIETLPEAGKEFANVESGTYLAVCYRVLDLGTQETTYLGEKKQAHKILIGWELCEEMMPADEDGEIKPFTINNRYTWSMSPKANLRKDLEAWRGQPFEPKDLGQGGFQTKHLLNVPCMLTVTKSEKEGKTYSNVTGIGPIMKSLKGRVPPLVNKTQFLDLDHTKFDRAVFESLSENLKKTIGASPEYVSIFSGPKANAYAEKSGGFSKELDDEIPF